MVLICHTNTNCILIAPQITYVQKGICRMQMCGITLILIQPEEQLGDESFY